jgi:hypothetical protein
MVNQKRLFLSGRSGNRNGRGEGKAWELKTDETSLFRTRRINPPFELIQNQQMAPNKANDKPQPDDADHPHN